MPFLRRRRPGAAVWPEPDAGWILPRRFDATTRTVSSGDITRLGTTGSGTMARIDGQGTVQLIGRPWTLEWWIGAEDRWHRSGSEINVRHHRPGAGPITETAMKVPGGDIVHRTAAVEAGAPVVVVEVENRSAVPVALALIVRPFGLDTAGRIDEVDVAGPVVTVDDEDGMVLDRVPAGVVGGDAAGDVAEQLGERADGLPTALATRCRNGLATAALVVPLAHGATVRAVMGTADPLVFSRLPTLDQVERGWQAHLDAGPRLDLPADQEWFDDARIEALLLAGGGGRDAATVQALRGLVRWGHPAAAEVPDWLGGPGQQTAGAVVLAVEAAARDRSPDWFDDYLGWAVDGVRRAGRVGDASGVADLVALLARAGQPDAATALAEDWRPPSRAAAEPTGEGRLAALIDSIAGTRPDGLDLLPDFLDAWLGQEVDVRDLPTPWGQLSFSIRWHGARPALLWEREPWPGAPPARLRCPGLDPEWSSSDERGEALLAVPARVGIDVAPGQSFG